MLRNRLRTAACLTYTFLIAFFALSSLVGCSGGRSGSSSLFPQAQGPLLPAAVTHQTASGHVGFAVEITPKKKAAGSRKPQYISPSTQSLAIYTDNELYPVVINLTPSSPNCSADPKHPGSYICTASLNVPSGNHIFTILAYDQTGGTGNILSTNSTGTVFVKPTGTTIISVVLQGIVYNVSLSLADSAPLAGNATAIALTVVLEDADFNVIVGPAPFDNPVTLTTSDATNGALSKTILNSPADVSGITVKYSGAEVSAITFGATAAPGPNSPPSITVTNAVLRPSETWKVPTDWNDTNNQIETIGGGGAGSPDGGGGGGGAYTKVTNIRLTGGSVVSIGIGGGGTISGPANFVSAGGNTYVCPAANPCSGSEALVLASGGGAGTGGGDGAYGQGGSGGAASSGSNTTSFPGGSGGNGFVDGQPAGGGGGAAGPLGPGAAGGCGDGVTFGGGGGNGGGSAGSCGSGYAYPPFGTYLGGNGGNNHAGIGGGIGSTGNGANGSAGGGGAGGAEGQSGSGCGGNGGNGVDLSASYGSGGGGGGGLFFLGGSPCNVGDGGGNGGLYGGGGGAASNGAGGIIVITYTPNGSQKRVIVLK